MKIKVSKNMLATVGYAIMIEGMTSEEISQFNSK